jgi:hypothetical protein
MSLEQALAEYETLDRKEQKRLNKKHKAFGGYKMMLKMKYKKEEFTCPKHGIIKHKK